MWNETLWIAAFSLVASACGSGCSGPQGEGPPPKPDAITPLPETPLPETPGEGRCVDTETKKYMGQSPDQCARMRFTCEPGREYFSDDCGCGCAKEP